MALESERPADIRLPGEVSHLRDLAYNLWWTWTPRARYLFQAIDGRLWAHYRNPVQVLLNIVDREHWRHLLDQGGPFLSLYRRVIREFDEYMHPDADTWFKRHHPEYNGGPVAYFSTEFGLHESLGIYSGGLGVLSGDHAKAASDLGLPFVGVSLLYRHGYFKQTVDADGRQQHIFDEYDFTRLPLRPLHNAAGRDLVVPVDLPGRTVQVRVWQLTVGRVPLFLLDTDIAANDPADRPITSQLYVRGRAMRLCQEIVLGVGGVRALHELRIQPAVWHMNEGHSVFQVAERLRTLRSQGLSPGAAAAAIRAATVFTTHTPVPAGNETFDRHLVQPYLEVLAQPMDLPVEDLLALGCAFPGQCTSQPFNLTGLALRFCSFANGVSKLHGKTAHRMWQHLLETAKPDAEPSLETPVCTAIHSVTNGVHLATWLGHDIRTLLEEHFGRHWREEFLRDGCWEKLLEISDRELWEAHQIQKERLIRLARTRMQEQYARHGEGPETLREVAGMMNPHALTIGFARRFATYKRSGLLFTDYERLLAIMKDKERPVQVIFSGKAHPADGPGQEMVQQIVHLATYSELKDRVFFLENYEIRIARHLVQGVDVWLNTPRRPREASGTSGMKAAMNGGLNLSVADGWWPEGYNGKNGWTIGNGETYDNDEMQDYKDSAALYDLLEQEIVPAFYDQRQHGMAPAWIERMKRSMITGLSQFSAARMLEDYIREAYLPAMTR